MLQVYKPDQKRYIFQDKYYGRKVTTSQFPSAVAAFLHDGQNLLIHHIPIILQKICWLAAIIRTLPRWRFYAASLLFIYDGDRDVQQEYAATNPSEAHIYQHTLDPGEMNIKLIDFAHCTTGDDFLPPLKPGEVEPPLRPGQERMRRARFPPVHAEEPDVGFLLGLQSICNSLKITWQEERKRRLKENPLDDIGSISIPDRKVFDCSLTKEAAAEALRTGNYGPQAPTPTPHTEASQTESVPA